MNILKIKRALAELVWTGALLFAAASVFLRPGAAAGGVLRGLSVCYETVIPALFPFLVLSRLLLESRAANALGLLLRPYTRLLGLHSAKPPSTPHFLFACANAAAWRAVSGPPWPAKRKRAKACPPAAVPSRKKHSRTPFRLTRVLFPPYGTRSTPS